MEIDDLPENGNLATRFWEIRIDGRRLSCYGDSPVVEVTVAHEVLLTWSGLQLPYMSQGAAQAIEDAAALGRCLARCSTVESLTSLTRYYEEIRKERAYAVQEKSALNGRIWHCEQGSLAHHVLLKYRLDPDGDDQRRRDAGMAASLTDEHYIRSTNQWSDPATQIWLYNHDAERVSTNYLDARLGPVTSSKRRGVDEMVEAGLLAA